MEQRQPAEHRLARRQSSGRRDSEAAGQLVGVGLGGDLGGAGGPSGVDERGEIVRRRRPRADQAVGRLAGDRVVEVGHVHARNGGQRRRGAGGRVGPQRQHRLHPGVGADGQQALPQRLVQLGPGRDQDPGSGAADQLRDVLRAEHGVDGCGDADGLRGQRRRVQRRGVDPAQRHRVGAPHSKGGQRVGDLGDPAGQVGVGPGEAVGVRRRVGDPLGGDGVGPGVCGVAQQLVRRRRHGQDVGGAHDAFPMTRVRWVPRSSARSAVAMVAVMRSPSCR